MNQHPSHFASRALRVTGLAIFLAVASGCGQLPTSPAGDSQASQRQTWSAVVDPPMDEDGGSGSSSGGGNGSVVSGTTSNPVTNKLHGKGHGWGPGGRKHKK